jgi:predicted transport protein
VEIDCRTFNDLDFNYIQNLSAIINDTNELGEFQIGNLKVTINDLTHYEHELIEC